MAPPEKTPPKPAPVYGKPEPKPPLWKRLLLWAFILCGLAGIGWMMHVSTPLKPLVCDPGVRPGLTHFGSCHEE